MCLYVHQNVYVYVHVPFVYTCTCMRTCVFVSVSVSKVLHTTTALLLYMHVCVYVCPCQDVLCQPQDSKDPVGTANVLGHCLCDLNPWGETYHVNRDHRTQKTQWERESEWFTLYVSPESCSWHSMSLVVDIAFVNSVCGGSLVVDIVCLVLLTQSVTWTKRDPEICLWFYSNTLATH